MVSWLKTSVVSKVVVLPSPQRSFGPRYRLSGVLERGGDRGRRGLAQPGDELLVRQLRFGVEQAVRCRAGSGRDSVLRDSPLVRHAGLDRDDHPLGQIGI